MANFLTDGRAALLAKLKADVQIASKVKTWFEFGAGLTQRYNLEPSACPLVALSPADGDAVRTANAYTDVTQRLRIELATDGQDAEPCEELVSLVLARLQACDADALGMSADGVVGVDVEGIRWRAVPDRSGARVVWAANVDIAILWKRT